MNSSIELQRQIKENAEDLRRFVSDLSSWEEEMKRKDSGAYAGSSKDNVVPPIRNATKKCDNSNSVGVPTSEEPHGVKKRISSNDYAAWEKFDVEKACDEVENSVTTPKAEIEEERVIKEKRLRDEANVEKEKGNQFVKKGQWDRAIECYSRAIKCYSRDAIFYCNRALCFLKKKDYRAAETDCTSALSLDSTYVKALHRRGLARKELNQLRDAAEDLYRASELEPNNMAVRSDFNTVLAARISETGDETMRQEVPIDIAINVERKLDPILPATKHRPPSSTFKETKSTAETAWPKVEDTVLIEPVKIPPHKQSKKPLLRIKIQEDCEITAVKTVREHNLPAQSASGTGTNVRPETLKNNLEAKREEDASSSFDNAKKSNKPKIAISKSELNSSMKIEASPLQETEVIPPVPKNSVQFLAAWRQIYKNSKICCQYLKQINGENLPKIFQDSLDGNILSQILNILASEFVDANEPVLSYIQGLTKVRRFRTLTLFLSQSDKESLEILFRHTQKLENTSSDLIVSIRKDYEF